MTVGYILAFDRAQWWTFVNTVINLWVPSPDQLNNYKHPRNSLYHASLMVCVCVCVRVRVCV